MKIESFIKIIGADFYAGVPDSQLKALCNYLMDVYGTDPRHHLITANEGNAAAAAAGYYLSTEKIPAVYMQNSGEGNIINPAASLLNDKVYAIPIVYIIGWRGEPGVHDEPQHIYQGEVTIKLLEDMDIKHFVISAQTSEEEAASVMEDFKKLLNDGKSAAFVIRKGALTYDGKVVYKNSNFMKREDVIKRISEAADTDPIVSTTGKASRELFEIREAKGQSHKYDFLTVGSMGHTSSIALGIAVNKPNTKIWCIDGDGAAIMHMGAMAVIGNCKPKNLVHIILNNESHETVGGMPTAASSGTNFADVAAACGYPHTVRAENFEELDRELKSAKKRNELTLIEIKCAIGSRKDLGRPTTTSAENKNSFMEYLKELR